MFLVAFFLALRKRSGRPLERSPCIIYIYVWLHICIFVYSSGYGLRENVQEKVRVQERCTGWHDQNRFKRELVLCLGFSLKSSCWKSHHIAITRATHSCRHHALRSGQSLHSCSRPHTRPTEFTSHQCRGVCGQYLHGICGVVDPLGTSEMHRICHTCATFRESEYDLREYYLIPQPTQYNRKPDLREGNLAGTDLS